MDLEKLRQALRFDKEEQFRRLLATAPQSLEIQNEILSIASNYHCPRCIKRLLIKGTMCSEFDRGKALEKAVKREYTENINPLLNYPKAIEPKRLIANNHKLFNTALEHSKNSKNEGPLKTVKLLLSKYPQEELIKLSRDMKKKNLIDRLLIVDKELKRRATQLRREIELGLRELI
jgi:hypothetical protein